MTQECTYKDHLNCDSLKFNGTEGVIGLTQWFERTEYVSSISDCTAENQVKFASCTLIGSDLTWWNSHMRAVSQEGAYAMPWKTLRQIMTVQYCPRGSGEKKPYGGTKPLCPKCNFHHDGPCGPKCTNCKRTGHITRVVEIELLTPTTITTTTTTTTEGPQRHIKEFPLALSVELKARNGNVVARAYGVGAAGGNPDANVVM
nr:hypothetical protein [Tanacetum cinerariifolium]